MKHAQTLGLQVLALAITAAVVTGCSGINASKSVSPMDFILPGLHMQNCPPSPPFPLQTNTAPLLAQASHFSDAERNDATDRRRISQEGSQL